ncbi:MAG: hypothetical protein R2748_10710 [Bryobacterales bacterium]
MAIMTAVSGEAREAHEELERLRGEVEMLAAKLDEEAFQQRPSETRRCGRMHRPFEPNQQGLPAENAGRRGAGSRGRPHRRGTGEARLVYRLEMFLWALEPPSKMKDRPLQAFLPRPGVSKDQTMREFREIRDRLGALMENVE